MSFSGSQWTLRWREMDSNFRFLGRETVKPVMGDGAAVSKTGPDLLRNGGRVRNGLAAGFPRHRGRACREIVSGHRLKKRPRSCRASVAEDGIRIGPTFNRLRYTRQPSCIDQARRSTDDDMPLSLWWCRPRKSGC
jgi:hypothetical protein